MLALTGFHIHKGEKKSMTTLIRSFLLTSPHYVVGSDDNYSNRLDWSKVTVLDDTAPVEAPFTHLIIANSCKKY